MKSFPKAPKAMPSVIEHHYHGTVIHRHEAARQMPTIRTREMGTQTDPVDTLEKPIEAAKTETIAAAPIITEPLPPRDKWYQVAFDTSWACCAKVTKGLRAWFNRHRYIFEVALNVAIFLFNRVNIGISLRPDPPR